MESALSLLDGNTQLILQYVQRAVVRHLEVVRAGHDAGQVVVGGQGRLAGLADDSEHWRERFEAYRAAVSKRKYTVKC